MKATGIVRRIDDLGRVVIPKEIRRQMKIREGDPLELYIEGKDGIVFKKYQQVDEEKWATAKKIIARVLGHNYFVLTDRDGDVINAGTRVAQDELYTQKVPYVKYTITREFDDLAELYVKTALSNEENEKILVKVLSELFAD